MAVQPTWYERDLPVLAATVAMLNELGVPGVVSVRSISERAGRDPQEVYEALLAMQPDYVTLTIMLTPDPNPHLVNRVTSEARRAVGQWPSAESLSDQLLAALGEAAEREPDADRKSKLRSAAQTLGGAGRDVLVAVVSTVIASHV
jgi:superfamily II DNA helicase RecQ